jgi:hypothetical protein
MSDKRFSGDMSTVAASGMIPVMIGAFSERYVSDMRMVCPHEDKCPAIHDDLHYRKDGISYCPHKNEHREMSSCKATDCTVARERRWEQRPCEHACKLPEELFDI